MWTDEANLIQVVIISYEPCNGLLVTHRAARCSSTTPVTDLKSKILVSGLSLSLDFRRKCSNIK